MRAPQAVLIFGPPGSGKSTQAGILADTFGFEVVDMGLVLRKVLFDPARMSDPATKAERDNYESGRLVSTEFFADLVHEKFRELEEGGVDAVLGGWPRSVEQAEGLMPKLLKAYGSENVHAFLIDIPEEVYRERSEKRLTCTVCNRPQLATAPAKGAPSACRVCGGALAARVDRDAIEARISVYNEQTVPLYAYLEGLGMKLTRVTWAEAPGDVYARIVQHLAPSL